MFVSAISEPHKKDLNTFFQKKIKQKQNNHTQTIGLHSKIAILIET